MPWVAGRICEPICTGAGNKRLGNPVIWSLRYLPAMMELQGDRGARPLLEEFAANVWEVPMGDDAIFMDVDTPEVLVEANRMCGGER